MPTWVGSSSWRAAPRQLVLWFGHWRKRGKLEVASPYPLRQELIWVKDTHVAPPAPLAAPRDERVWVFSESGPKARAFETSCLEEPIIPTFRLRFHRNEKPLGLMARLLALATDPSEPVVDPFAGSGSTLVAALLRGQPAVGIEANPEVAGRAAQRLRLMAEGRTDAEVRELVMRPVRERHLSERGG